MPKINVRIPANGVIYTRVKDYGIQPVKNMNAEQVDRHLGREGAECVKREIARLCGENSVFCDDLAFFGYATDKHKS